MPKVVVTGGSGKAGKACVRELKAHGYDVFSVDRVKPAEEFCPSIQADLADYGQALDTLSAVERCPHEVEGVVHLVAIPDSRVFTNSVTFENNVMSTYNVFEASTRLGGSRTWCGPQARRSWESSSTSRLHTCLWTRSMPGGLKAPTC